MLDWLDIHEQNNEPQNGHRSKPKMWKRKTFRRKQKRNICVLELSKEFLGMTPKTWYAKQNW